MTPDPHGDWINQRDPGFNALMPLYEQPQSVFLLHSSGIETRRDAWVYGFNREKVLYNTRRMMAAYNRQIPTSNPARNPKEFSWSRKTYRLAKDGTRLRHDATRVVTGLYRPFAKQFAYFDRSVNEEVSQQERIFPNARLSNIGIAINAKDKKNPVSCLMSNVLPDRHTVGDAQFLPRWTYAKAPSGQGFERISNINPQAVAHFRDLLGQADITEDDLFYYTYGILHHIDYRTMYAANLRKEAARLPIVPRLSDFCAFVEAGKSLANLHVNYESVEPYPLEEELTGNLDMLTMYRVTKKMKHPGKRGSEDQSALVYNEYITLRGIPQEAHRYVLGQYSALRWLVERYYVETDKTSGIVNDPNDWAEEHGNCRYIIDLIKRVVTVSVKTVEIVNGLPALPAS